MNNVNGKNLLIKIFMESLAAVNPAKLITENFKIELSNLHVCDKVYDISNSNFYLTGFGKAVLGMAHQCEKILGNRLKRGIICVPEFTQRTFSNSLAKNSVIKLHEGARNNLPDENAEAGAREIIHLVESVRNGNDILIVLISGGGSALFPKAKPGISLADKVETIKLLTSSGADITELNTVRKKLSEVKGGGLACLSYPTRTICLILSDIVSDPLDLIASGPTTPNLDEETAAFDILQKYKLLNKVPKTVLKVVEEASPSATVPLVKNAFIHVDNFIVGSNAKALAAAKQFAESADLASVIMSSRVTGLVPIIANFYRDLLFEIINYLESKQNFDFSPKIETLVSNIHFDCDDTFINELTKLVNDFSNKKTMCIIAGGETTVEVTGNGKGGRNQELALYLAIRLHELKSKFLNFFNKFDVMFLSAGTDGIDGPTDAAGAVGESAVVEQLLTSDINLREFLARNDSYNFFQRVNGGSHLIKTGHTGTNVMDIHLVLIMKKVYSLSE